MICPNCGTSDPGPGSFCMSCGYRLPAPTKAAPAPLVPGKQPGAPPTPASAPPAPPATSPPISQMGSAGTVPVSVWGPFAGYGARVAATSHGSSTSRASAPTDCGMPSRPASHDGRSPGPRWSR